MTSASVWAPGRLLLTLGLLGLVTAVAFEGMAVPTILPATVAELGHLELYGWAFSAFWLTNIVGITLAGGDADRHGAARSFALGVALFAVGLAISGAAPSMTLVIAGRAVQGLGSGAIAAIVYVVMARGYQPRTMPRMVALVSSAWVVPGLVGPALAGLVADHLSWRWVFIALAPAVIVIGLLVIRPIRALGSAGADPGGGTGRRAAESVRLAAGSALLLAGIGSGQALAAVAMLLLGGWLSIAALRRLLPDGTLRLARGQPAVIALVFGVAFAFFGAEAFVPLAVTTLRGESTTVGGLALSAAAVTWAIGAWLPDRLARRSVTRRMMVAAGGGLIAVGIGVTALALLPTLPVWLAALGWAIGGLGIGLAYSTLTLLVLQSSTPGAEGRSSSSLQLMFTLGTALGAGLGGAIVAASEAGVVPLGVAIALADALMIGAILTVVALSGRLPADAGGQSRVIDAAAPASPSGAMGH